MEVKIFKSSDTNVSKFVFEWDNPSGIAESVLYRYGSYRERTVICCSVQSGCPVGCTFCGTGKFFIRNLVKDEIVSQVNRCLSTIDCDTRYIKKFQIMFMSMGEPFLNYRELKLAIIELHDLYPNADLLVSTSAPSVIYKYIADFIELSKFIPKVGLQFSVHESLDENRKKLIPTSTCTLRQISAIGELWASFVGRKPFYNYCVHDGNCSYYDACRLVDLFNTDVWETTLSVICEKDESVASSIDRQLSMINDFSTHMTSMGASIRVFNPAGQDDIGGGCGQLWYFQEWLKNNNKRMEVKIKNQNELIDARVEMIDGVMVVPPKEVKFEPKEGDVITIENKSIPFTLIVKNMGKSKTVFSHALLFNNGSFSKDDFISYENLHPATEEEKQKLYQAIAGNGYKWDAEKNQLVKLKWKPKFGEVYYTPSFNEFEFEPHVYGWVEDKTDLILYGMGWVFDTKVKCQEFCDRLNKAIENIKP